MLNVIALLVAAVVTPVYTNTYTKGGVTYSQLGGIKSSNYVATAVSFEMPSNIVNSVNGKTGEVKLDAEDVGSLPIGGGTMTGSIVLGDNTHLKSYFGANVIWYADGEIWGWNNGDDYGHPPSFKLTYPQRDGELAVTSDIPPPYTPDPKIVKIGANGMETIDGYYLSALDFGAVPISGGLIEDIRLKGAFEFGPFAYMHIQREPLEDEHDETYFYLDHFVRKYRPQGGGSAPIETFSIFLPEKSGTLAVGSDITSAISHTSTHFSNEVLAVGLNIDTNSIAQINAILNALGGVPIGETATTVGGLLLALAAAVAWLKKNALRKGLTGGVPDDENVAALFTTTNSSLMGVVRYEFYSVPSTGLLKDRAINTTNLASVTVPDDFTDLLIRASVTTSLPVTMPDAITKYGDTFPAAEGEYLITITKMGDAEAYVRVIKLEVAQ